MPISPYLRHLRERIGGDLVLLPAVAVLPWDADGRVLLLREADTGLWATIGGMIEPDESPRDAARREAEEEAGITVRLDRLRSAEGGDGYRIAYPNGDLVSYVSIVFDATIEDGTPRPDGDESLELAWFAPHELGSVDLHPFNRRLLADLGLHPGG